MGEYLELYSFNRSQNPAYTNKAFAFARWDKSQKLIVVTNFDEFKSVKTTLKLSPELLKAWNLEVGNRDIQEVMFGKKKTKLRVTDTGAEIDLDFGPWESAVFEVR
ncbi:hypothetical protein Aconfl_08190 [Algoriphagus confluentis]|uniref:Alpha-amylase/branching enzyme C-terminal all beta domain-containing protein n=2 Tax=Algoriphagus confluentis TaxID=1697556 RepID=A0ABQ6PJP6_9BACT|nr:hypothetical protein Aconfl_08190 [Algoriphagus confluentis]